MIKRRMISAAVVTVLLIQMFFMSFSASALSEIDYEVNASKAPAYFTYNRMTADLNRELTEDKNRVVETVLETGVLEQSENDPQMIRNVVSSYSEIVDGTYSSSYVSKKEWLEMFIEVFNLSKCLSDEISEDARFNCENIFELGVERDMYLSDSFSEDPYNPVKRKEAGDTIALYLGYPLHEYTSNDNDELIIQTNLQTALYYGYLELDKNGNANPGDYLTREDFEKIHQDLLKYVEFREKTIVGFGDSIMAGDGNYAVGIVDLIADKYKMTVYDYGVGGSAFEYKDEKPAIHEQIVEALKAGIKPDYILIDGGVNDLKLGNMGEMMSEDNFSYLSNGYTSFASGMEYCFGLLKDNYADVPLLYIRTHMMTIYPKQQISYGKLAFEICEKWCVPYLDLYTESGFDADNSQLVSDSTLHNEDFPEGDSIHPNQDMYMKYYIPKVTDAIYNIVKE